MNSSSALKFLLLLAFAIPNLCLAAKEPSSVFDDSVSSYFGKLAKREASKREASKYERVSPVLKAIVGVGVCCCMAYLFQKLSKGDFIKPLSLAVVAYEADPLLSSAAVKSVRERLKNEHSIEMVRRDEIAGMPKLGFMLLPSQDGRHALPQVQKVEHSQTIELVQYATHNSRCDHQLCLDQASGRLAEGVSNTSVLAKLARMAREE